jgi:hypothetical protein
VVQLQLHREVNVLSWVPIPLAIDVLKPLSAAFCLLYLVRSKLNVLLLLLFIRLEWNQVHYYWGHLLAYCISLEWQMMMVVDQSVEWTIDKGNRSTGRKPTSVSLCPPQILHDLTRATAVGSWRLTSWATARPYICVPFTSGLAWFRKWGCRIQIWSTSEEKMLIK